MSGDPLELVPLGPEHADALIRIVQTPAVARRWGPLDDGFPLTDDPDSTRFAIVVDGAVAGMIQYGEELYPMYRHASIDVFLDASVHGRGFGTEVVRRVARLLFEERGHHRITIDPAADNAVAIKTYKKVGFRPVGILRAYERDPLSGAWHDGLLMDMLAGELT
jgi:aminoglycoside 6'-N-acetyltransferase